jgi:hypothetical protein
MLKVKQINKIHLLLCKKIRCFFCYAEKLWMFCSQKSGFIFNFSASVFNFHLLFSNPDFYNKRSLFNKAPFPMQSLHKQSSIAAFGHGEIGF